ncbi:MAG: DUF2452 domain-containing protein [Flavobacteriaceae bacterium]
MSAKKRPDSVVYNEESEQFDAFLKPYSTSVTGPVIKPTDLTGWKQRGAHQVNARFQARIDELKKAYETMMKEVEDNQKVYQASFSFEPVVGKVYHLYNKPGKGLFLSLLSPDECRFDFEGSYRLDADQTWTRVKTEQAKED